MPDISSSSSGGTGGGPFDGGIYWDIPNFFTGVTEVSNDGWNAIVSILPNPDPFPAMIDSLNPENAQFMSIAVWWLDDAYDLLFIRDMLGYWTNMMIVAIGIMLCWKLLNFIRGA